MAAEELAAAKINLTLHVTGRRADGYHLLDSLVVFADIGDSITVEPAPALGLELTGPEAGGLVGDEDNLVLRAARLFPPGNGAAIRLDKVLPVASGIGGGSADAAATLRALARHWQVPLPGPAAVLSLGADVPVCLGGRPARMTGIGDGLQPVPPLPAGLSFVLVNPRVAVATVAVFARLARRDNAPMPDAIPAFDGVGDLARWLAGQRNDLEAPAVAIAPVIADVLAAIHRTDPALARMSGSGATCFGIYPDRQAARRGAAAIAKDNPGWWVRDCGCLPEAAV